VLERAADCRYEGQGYELRVSAPSTAVDGGWSAAVRETFEARHEREYFGKFAELGVHVITVRVTGIGRMPALRWPTLQRASDDPARAQIAQEPVVFAADGGSERVDTRIYVRERLLAGDEIPGPAIVEQQDSTTVIPPGARARIDDIGNLVLSVQEA